MKIIVSGGGTGGHIYPALAIADEIKRRYADAEVLYVGCPNSLEQELAGRSGYNFASVNVKGMPRRLNKQSLIAFAALLKGLKEAKKLLKAFKPDVVVGTGGYVSFPVIYQATKLGIPTLVQEQNAFPGVANKLLSRFVDKICLGYEDAKKRFKRPEICTFTGNPVRAQFVNSGVSGKSDYVKQVLIFGGSGGQKSLNEAFIAVADKLGDKKYRLIHICGKNHYENVMGRVTSVPENVTILAYSHELAKLLSESDLVVTSSSAMALAEISYLGLPSILVPKAYTAENHQEYNARVYHEHGAAQMIMEKDLNSDTLFNTIDEIISDDDRLITMGTRSRELGVENATKKIADEVEILAFKKDIG